MKPLLYYKINVRCTFPIEHQSGKKIRPVSSLVKGWRLTAIAVLLMSVSCNSFNEHVNHDAQSQVSSEAQVVVPDATNSVPIPAAHILIALKNVSSDGLSDPKTKIEAREKALDIYRKIQNGASFEKSAEAHSDCASRKQGGFIGDISPRDLGPTFYHVLQSLIDNEVHPPVESDLGFHIIKRIPVSSPKTATLSELVFHFGAENDTGSASSRTYLPQSEARAKALAAIAEIQSGRPFEEVAKRASTESTAVSAGYLGIVRLDDLPVSISSAVHQLSVGEVLNPPIAYNGSFYIFYKMESLPETEFTCTMVRFPFQLHGQSSLPTKSAAYNDAATVIKKMAANESLARTQRYDMITDTYYANDEEYTFAKTVLNLKIGEFTTTPIEREGVFYVIRREQYRPREKLSFSLIMISHSQAVPKHPYANRDKASAYSITNRIIRELENDKEFHIAAKEYSEHVKTKPEGGRVKDVFANALPLEIRQQVNALEPGEYSTIPIDLPDGYYILHKEAEKGCRLN